VRWCFVVPKRGLCVLARRNTIDDVDGRYTIDDVDGITTNADTAIAGSSIEKIIVIVSNDSAAPAPPIIVAINLFR